MGAKITNAELKEACEQMLTENITYAQMDCQAAVENALMRCGVPASECGLAGSNAHYRACLWRGTPEQCCELLGVKEVPAGMFMFIVKSSGEPAKYHGDGYGNADHIGIYMGGGLTFNSSASRGGVVASTTFGGKKAVPNGGWNMVGLPEWVDCGLSAAQLAALTGNANATPEDTATPAQEATTAAETAAVTPTYAVVVTPDGNPVRAREKPNGNAIWKYTIPNGTRLQVLGERAGYHQVHWLGKGRWVKREFLQML